MEVLLRARLRAVAPIALAMLAAVGPIRSVAAEPSGVEAAYRQFAAAKNTRDWRALMGAVDTLDLPPEKSLPMVRAYFDFLQRLDLVGQEVVSDEVTNVEYFDEGRVRIAFLKVRSSFKHPMRPQPVPVESMQYGFSRDGGRTWTFNVLDCLEEADLKRVAPAYSGVPAMPARGAANASMGT